MFETCERDVLKLVYEKEDLLVNHGGKDPDYNFYKHAGTVTAAGGKGEHLGEDRPVNFRSNMP
jgi:NADH-quinone oxidoreductase subunit I